MIEKKEVDYAKEVGDVMNLVVGLVGHFRAGKSAAEATALLPELLEAVSGMDNIDDELEESKQAVMNAVLLGAAELVNALLVKEDAPVAE